MRGMLMAVVLAGGAPAGAETERVEITQGDVAAAMDRLESAVAEAGAEVFARVDHQAGAESVEMELAPAQVLIFGNPRIGTPAMQADPVAGLHLPLRVLGYEGEDGTAWLVYETPASMFDGLDVPQDAEFLGQMSTALQNLTQAAAGGG